MAIDLNCQSEKILFFISNIFYIKDLFEKREILLLGGPDKLTYTCKQVLDQFGWSFSKDAKQKFDDPLTVLPLTE